MKKISLILILFVSSNVIAQDDLDDIFDDGDKESKIHIGTNITTLLGGTINASIDLTPVEMITLNIGAGFIPFSTHRDFSYWRPEALSDEDLQVKDTMLSGGNYLTIAAKFNATNLSDLALDYYYYVSYKMKNFNLMEDIIAVNQRKFSLGMGYKFRLIGRFNAELQLGISSATDNTILKSNDFVSTGIKTRGYELFDLNDSESVRAIGLDLGLSLTYAL